MVRWKSWKRLLSFELGPVVGMLEGLALVEHLFRELALPLAARYGNRAHVMEARADL